MSVCVHLNIVVLEETSSSSGLLLVTGILWGCTNPFIRRGTRGLRAVRGRSWLSQLYAEGVFLLGNWKYVVPWLVNQGGSLAYLAALQRLPLCVAVPGANSLAFVCTAATGAANLNTVVVVPCEIQSAQMKCSNEVDYQESSELHHNLERPQLSDHVRLADLSSVDRACCENPAGGDTSGRPGYQEYYHVWKHYSHEYGQLENIK
ncbi:unnamed protein product [Leptidea sinapis]|uniref:Transmembrane protein 234 n=1 Tax=Leptidea sinapis TaxID=189913 RepID=A0A5E4PUA3_9NEOP|nr:unnamed protein product [Leptidea sinapis]